MDGLDSLYVRLGTHYIDNNKIESLLEEIINKDKYDKEFVDNLFDQNAKILGEEKSPLEKELEYIKKHFSKESLVDIFNSLENDNTEWAKNTLKVLSKKSPTSMSVTAKQLSEA